MWLKIKQTELDTTGRILSFCNFEKNIVLCYNFQKSGFIL